MTTPFQKIEACQRAVNLNEPTALHDLTTLLYDNDWRVRYAAIVALGDMGSAAIQAIPILLSLLAKEDAAPLYTQPGEISGGPAGANIPMQPKLDAADALTLDAWRRRGRLKQAALWTLAQIGSSAPQILSFLHRYALDQKEDYSVRAAACRALGVIGDLSSLPVLEKASCDGEWCTHCEAKKSLQLLSHSV